MTPQETIAAAIVEELEHQRDNLTIAPGAYIDAKTYGTDDVVLDGHFNLDRVGEALIDKGLAAGGVRRIWVRWSDDGTAIRKWSSEPFPEAEPIDAMAEAQP